MFCVSHTHTHTCVPLVNVCKWTLRESFSFMCLTFGIHFSHFVYVLLTLGVNNAAFFIPRCFCSLSWPHSVLRHKLTSDNGYAAVLYLSSPKNRMIASSLWLLSLNSLNFIDAKIKKKKKKLYWSNIVMHSEICSLHFTAQLTSRS